jgi:hypothetical protein
MQHVIWYKDAATVIALVSLLVSLAASAITIIHTRTQDLQTAHLDLRAVLQRLLAVPKEGLELRETYKGNDDHINFVNTLLQQELNVLASQGANAVRMLGPKVVSSPEYLTIARAQSDAGNAAAQREFITLACSVAKTPGDKLMALRDSGGAMFMDGNVQEGRRQYEAAMQVLNGAAPKSPEFAVTFGVDTQLTWAMLESRIPDNLAVAQAHITQAEQIAGSLPPGPLRDALEKRIQVFVNGPGADSAGATGGTGTVQAGGAPTP